MDYEGGAACAGYWVTAQGCYVFAGRASGVAMDCAACAKHRGLRAWGAHLSWSAELIF